MAGPSVLTESGSVSERWKVRKAGSIRLCGKELRGCRSSMWDICVLGKFWSSVVDNAAGDCVLGSQLMTGMMDQAMRDFTRECPWQWLGISKLRW